MTSPRQLIECRFDPRKSRVDRLEPPRDVRFGPRVEPPPAALNQRSGDGCRDHRKKADPCKHHDRSDESSVGLPGRDIPVSDRRDRLQREPQTLPDCGELPMVDHPFQDSAGDGDQHRKPGDDPGSSARRERLAQQQPRSQRDSVRTIGRLALHNLTLATFNLAHVTTEACFSGAEEDLPCVWFSGNALIVQARRAGGKGVGMHAGGVHASSNATGNRRRHGATQQPALAQAT